MAKAKGSVFFCGECGYESTKWLGKCPACGSWNTMLEQKKISSAPSINNLTYAHAIPLADVTTTASGRVSSGIGELDRVLGGGIVPGSVTLLGGDPGIGKSTLLMQTAAELTKQGTVLYVTGEESASQLKLRAERLGVGGDMLILAENDLSAIESEVDRVKPAYVMIDSIQTMYSADCSGTNGSISQIREATSLITRMAKRTGAATFIVGHVTKDGAIAGPRILEHMVDTVLYFEGDRQDSFRLLRSVKNRFGSTDEIGVFEMRSTGMAEISDPSTLFITGADLPGCAVTCAMEGTRPMMVEVQALLSTSPFSNPRRMAAGLDNNRLVLLLAVLEKKAGLRFYDKDVYTNVVGGIRLDERAGDLAVAMCIAGAGADIALPPRTAILGELSLTGEVRPVNRLDKRIQECARLGFSHIVVPNSDTLPRVDGLNYTRVKNIREALCILGI
ncbi:MAG: DNA repair protein RadA [Eubacteriales bacterium]|nr:DNA repair protein RadA [Eubacteriales bacterium]MDY4397743.1 DNA repair protein RadA [Eubacteriales bacterium]MDY5512897.1 DNA repair protein RadA [Eubacteriales bacterium]MDY5800560.1 DNA repair protein RadA [Eubacteriales bacterium]